MSVTISMFAFVSFVAGSITYVYRVRGHERYADFAEYFRKGWPIFTPLNCLLYLFTQRRARRSIMDMQDFGELAEIQANWQVIRKEVLALYEQGYFENTTKAGASASYDIGFRTFFKYGWSKFYLKWYGGYTHQSAIDLCPETVKVLKDIRSVNGAMFTVMKPKSQLTRHLDPAAASLRYHLGLSTPNSDTCYINVDGEKYSWRDGEAFMFDETYLHYVRNDSDQPRLILMCDVERPMNIFGQIFNVAYKFLMRFTVVPNIEGDRRGLANIIFSSLAPILAKTKALKETNRTQYLILKYSINTLLGLILLGLIAGVMSLFASLF